MPLVRIEDTVINDEKPMSEDEKSLLDKIPFARSVLGYVMGEPTDKGDQTVRFAEPKKMAKRVQSMRVLLIVAGLLAVISAVSTLPLVNEMTDNADEAEAQALEYQDAAYDQYLLAHESGNSAMINQASTNLVQVTQFYDSTIVLAKLLLLALIVLGGVVIWIPIRYILLIRGMKTGNPRIWWQIRALARFQIAIELVKIGVVYWATYDTYLLDPEIGFAATILIAPVVLWMLSRPDVKSYFSYHQFESDAVPAPSEQA